MHKQLLLLGLVLCVAAITVLNLFLTTIPGTAIVSVGLFMVTVVLIRITHGVAALQASAAKTGEV